MVGAVGAVTPDLEDDGPDDGAFCFAWWSIGAVDTWGKRQSVGASETAMERPRCERSDEYRERCAPVRKQSSLARFQG